MFASAKEYLEDGWSVIPLIGKRPALGSWKEYQERQPTLGTALHWFGEQREIRYNIGVVTGRVSGLVVVDCETLEEGRRFWRVHPTQLISKTGGGGVHLFYAYAPQGNRTRVDGRELDIRGDGGYVVAPPSIHPTGTPYEWCLEGEPALFDPAWVRECPEFIAVPHAVGKGGSAEAVARARSYIGRIMAISGQGGHNATFRSACKLRDFGLDEETAFQLLSEWNETNAKPRWTAKELRHKIQDAFSRPEVQG